MSERIDRTRTGSIKRVEGTAKPAQEAEKEMRSIVQACVAYKQLIGEIRGYCQQARELRAKVTRQARPVNGRQRWGKLRPTPMMSTATARQPTTSLT